MTSKLRVALLFALVIALAGCSGGTGNGAGIQTTTDLPDGTPTADDPANDSADDNSDTSGTDDSADDNSDTSGTDNPDDWQRTDAQIALESAGSYTTSWVWRSNVDDTSEMTVTARVDLAAERINETMIIGGTEVNVIDSYYADGTEYTRYASEDGSDATYFQTGASFADRSSVWDFGYAYDASDFGAWTDQGVETYDGVSVRRYVYEASSDEFASSQAPDADFEVTSSRLELLVDRDGVPRYQHYEIEGTDTDGTDQWFEWELTVSNVGSTTVEEPDWVQVAQTQ